MIVAVGDARSAKPLATVADEGPPPIVPLLLAALV